ncbi:MAG: hypothetical protein KH354_05320 [Clostridiales bacterium]|nr:hypothetical protein [Clostridiales bacterium]
MAKIYTLDGKLLTERPEIRIGDKIYAVDDRTSTVKKLSKLDTEDTQAIYELALGKEAAKEVAAMDLPFAADIQLCKLVVAAMTGEDPAEVEERFRAEQSAD